MRRTEPTSPTEPLVNQTLAGPGAIVVSYAGQPDVSRRSPPEIPAQTAVNPLGRRINPLFPYRPRLAMRLRIIVKDRAHDTI